jgi:hypothetical protein
MNLKMGTIVLKMESDGSGGFIEEEEMSTRLERMSQF